MYLVTNDISTLKQYYAKKILPGLFFAQDENRKRLIYNEGLETVEGNRLN